MDPSLTNSKSIANPRFISPFLFLNETMVTTAFMEGASQVKERERWLLTAVVYIRLTVWTLLSFSSNFSFFLAATAFPFLLPWAVVSAKEGKEVRRKGCNSWLVDDSVGP